MIADCSIVITTRHSDSHPFRYGAMRSQRLFTVNTETAQIHTKNTGRIGIKVYKVHIINPVNFSVLENLMRGRAGGFSIVPRIMQDKGSAKICAFITFLFLRTIGAETESIHDRGLSIGVERDGRAPIPDTEGVIPGLHFDDRRKSVGHSKESAEDPLFVCSFPLDPVPSISNTTDFYGFFRRIQDFNSFTIRHGCNGTMLDTRSTTNVHMTTGYRYTCL